MRKLIILGVNGNAGDIAEMLPLLRLAGRRAWTLAGFLDDTRPCGFAAYGTRVVGKLSEAPKFAGCWFVNAIGSPASYVQKPEVIRRAGVSIARFATLLHPSAVVSPSARLGMGVVILSHASLGSGVTVGNHVMVLQNTVVSHDSVVGDYACLATSVALSGRVTIGENAYLGSHCCVRSGQSIGAKALVGMGAVVVKDVPPGQVWAGNPACRLKRA